MGVVVPIVCQPGILQIFVLFALVCVGGETCFSMFERSEFMCVKFRCVQFFQDLFLLILLFLFTELLGQIGESIWRFSSFDSLLLFCHNQCHGRGDFVG